MKISRRKFLKQFSVMAGCFATSASLISCGKSSSDIKAGQSPRYTFPQGIASADPQADAILLWTRMVDTQGGHDVSLVMQLSNDQNFEAIIAEQALTAGLDSDHTVRCFVDSLEADQWYYYRFITPDGYASRTGRTRTAPAPDAATPLNIAMFSCQNYESGYFNAYRRFMVDDEQANADKKIDLCIHVGDFIYENVNGGTLDPAQPGLDLKNTDGSPRNAGDLPSGGKSRGRGKQVLPQTLDDYRHIYKSYLSDPSIQAARAWYPFSYIWDDHEVLNDYWQAYHPGGSLQTLKVMGNQTWFEYIPAMLSDARPGPAGNNPASDFEFVDVKDADPGEFDEDYLSLEPNTRAAINSMSIYRSLQWGTLADILLVDGRSYRGPRGLDASILGGDRLIPYPPAPIDPDLIYKMNAGRTANNNNPPATLMYEGKEIENPRKNSPRGSMLGARQKQWLKDNLSSSTANWRLLCNNLPMMRFGFDTQFQENGYASGIYWTDSWDGSPIERNELMAYIRENDITNVISLTGDRHAHFAGLVLDDYEADKPEAVMPELAGAGVSAADRLSIQMILFKDEALLKRTGFDGERVGYHHNTAPAMNAWMLYGEHCAEVLSETADVVEANKVKDPAINPHLHFADSDAYGYYRVFVREDNINTEFVTIPLPVKDESQTDPEVMRRVSMDIPAWARGESPEIKNIQLAGKHNFLGIKP